MNSFLAKNASKAFDDHWLNLFRLPEDDIALFPNQTKIPEPPFLVILKLIQLLFPFLEYRINVLQYFFLSCSYPDCYLKPLTKIPLFLQFLIL